MKPDREEFERRFHREMRAHLESTCQPWPPTKEVKDAILKFLEDMKYGSWDGMRAGEATVDVTEQPDKSLMVNVSIPFDPEIAAILLQNGVQFTIGEQAFNGDTKDP